MFTFMFTQCVGLYKNITGTIIFNVNIIFKILWPGILTMKVLGY